MNTHGTPTLPDDPTSMERLGRLAASAGGAISLAEVSPSAAAASWSATRPSPAPLDAARFDRGLDHHWRRTSYTGITRDRPHPVVGSEPGELAAEDEDMPPGGAPAADDAGQERRLRAVPSPLAAVGGGTAFGTFVHAVLEGVDFAAEDLDAALAEQVERQLARRSLDVGDLPTFTAALHRVLATPLGPLFDEVALRQVDRSDRLDELEFELPLIGGLDPTGQVSVADIAAVLGRSVPDGDPLAGYAERLADPTLHGVLRGYLTGSIDAVVRLHRGPDPRFSVVDYKTNWLGVDDEPLSAWHYRPSALADAMSRAHYPLQALLYSVALHRYLRWRLPGYDPDRHLGGVAYLFVRGMTGPDVPRVGGAPCGVFAWQPPAGLVPDLSDVLHRGGAAA